MSDDLKIKWADIISNIRSFLLIVIAFIVVVEIMAPLTEWIIEVNHERKYIICFRQEIDNESTNGCYCSEINTTKCSEFMEDMGYSQKEAKV